MTENENAPVPRKKLPIVERAPKRPLPKIEVTDLTGVIYSSGKVFEGLRTDRLDTENFLRSGSTEGVTSRQDLHVLQDLRDVAQLVIDHRGQPIDAAFAIAVNSTITRSGSMEPGRFRSADQDIGVHTAYGRHTPPAIGTPELAQMIEGQASLDPKERAARIFIDIAKAQPFMDGNKRTALFVANAVLLEHDSPEMLIIPFDENDPSVSQRFNDLLSRAYVLDEIDGVTRMLQEQGFSPLKPRSSEHVERAAEAPVAAQPVAPEQTQNSSFEARKAAISARVAELDHGDQDEQFER